MEAWKKTEEMKDGDDGFDIFINCCGIGLEKNFKNDPQFEEEGRKDRLVATVAEKEAGEFLSPKYKAYLEDVLDIETIYVIMEVAGGIKLNDPKLMEAVLAAQNQSVGTTSN